MDREWAFQERLRKYNEEQNRLDAENRKLQWQWQEYQKLSQNTRERGAQYDHGRWSSGWQEGCGHRRGTCAVKSEWVTYNPNNPDHRHLKKGKSGGKRSRDWDMVYVTKSTDPNKPYNLPYSKHPNRRVQERLDRQRDIGVELERLKTERKTAITEENTRKIEKLRKEGEANRALIKKEGEIRRKGIQSEAKKKKRQTHPEGWTTRPVARRHASGAQSRYVTRKRPQRRSPPPRRYKSAKGSVFRR